MPLDPRPFASTGRLPPIRTKAAVHYSEGFVKDVELIQVVRTRLTVIGKGTEDSPLTRLTQYWTLDGELLAEVDPRQAA